MIPVPRRNLRDPWRLRAIAWVVAALALANCGGGSTATPSAEPVSPTAATPPAGVACGMEITTSVMLTADLACDPLGLIVTGDGAVVDLGGHTLSGPGAGRRSWPMPNFDVVGIIVAADNVTIRHGTVAQFGISVLLDEVRGVTVEGVHASGSYYGVYIYRGGENAVVDSAIVENVYGLHLQESDGNRAVGNDLSRQTHHSPGGYGLYLYASNSNWFEGNTIRDNLNWGLWFSDSTGNTIVRNNIIANDPQVSDDTGGNSFYDADRREGNYWSDYQGTDDNGDGIGDVPYMVGGPGRAVDVYPFMSESGWVGRTSRTVVPATPPPAPDLAPRAYVVLADGRIAAIAPDTVQLLDIWQAGAFGPLSVSPDGATLYALVGDATSTSVVAFDTQAGTERGRWEVLEATAIAATYDGQRVIVSSPHELTDIVLATGELRRQQDGSDAVAIVPSWKHNLVLTVRGDGWLAVVYLPDQHSPFGVQLPGAAIQAVDNRAGTRLFVLLRASDAVQIVDTEQFAVTDRVPLGEIDPLQARIAPSPDGTMLYVLDTARSRIVSIDLGTKRILHAIALSGQAVDLSLSADGEYVTVVAGEGNVGRAIVFDRELRPLGAIQLPAAPVSVAASR